MPGIDVVCVTFNSAEVIGGFLDALPAAMQGVCDWSITVVDNDSTDDSLSVVHAAAPWAQVLEQPTNGGYSAAINAGLSSIEPERDVLVVNPDIRFEPGSVAILQATLLRESAGIVVPRLVDGEGHVAPSLRRTPTVLRAWGESLFGGTRAGRIAALGEMVTAPEAYRAGRYAEWASGAAWLISRPCLDAVGDWDESFFLYSEETDYALRAADAGFRLVYEPAATAVHLGGEQGRDPSLWALSVSNRVRLFRRRHGPLRSAAFRLGLFVGEALRARRASGVHRSALQALARPGLEVTDGFGVLRFDEPSAGSAPTPQPSWLCFAAQDWWYHNRAHSDFQLMTRIANIRPVLLVNSIGLRMPTPGRSTMVVRRIARKARSVAKLVRRPLPDVPGFVVMTPLVIPLYDRPRIRALNAALVRAQVRLVARVVGVHAPVVFATMPTAADPLVGMSFQALLFNRSDRHSEFPEGDRATIEAMEESLLRRADRVLYVSHALMADDAETVGDRAVFIDHGVDLAHFRFRQPDQRPPELADVTGPVIGFFGGLDDYVVDLALLERVAIEIPEATLVLVGDATCPMDRLTRLPNVRWFGFRPYEDIPGFGSAFDVAVMPWLDNEWIRLCNPIKLKEYLALGLPVVSMDYPEVHAYGGLVRVASDPTQFVAQVRASLADGGPATPAARRAAVAGSSWDQLAERLVALGDELACEGRTGRMRS